jgi:hypothetical protein
MSEETIFTTKLLDRIQSSEVGEEAQEELVRDGGLFCSTCNHETVREHFRSDWHRYNLKRKLKSLDSIDEMEFEEMLEISSIESEEEEELSFPNTGTPFVHFNLDTKEEFLVYKQVLSPDRNADWTQELQKLQRSQIWTLLLLASGHFAGMVIDCTTKTPIVHKAFHRYTTRRKQGGAQSSNDKSKGKANSAGAGIRRYNEQALREEIQELLTTWSSYIQQSNRIFIRAPPTMRKILFFDKKVLESSDQKVRSFPFITKRPTLQELTRCFEELTKVRVVPKSDATEIQKKVTSPPRLRDKTHLVYESEQKVVEMDENLNKLIDFIKKGKLEQLKSNFDLKYLNHTFDASLGISLLHIASSSSQPDIVQYLLDRGADPTLFEQKKPLKAYDVAGNKETRDVFRRFMFHHPDKWDYKVANIPGPLTPEMEEKQAEKEKERKKKEKERKKLRKEQQKIDQMETSQSQSKEPVDVVKSLTKKTGLIQLSQSERQTSGMTPEQKLRYEREKRFVTFMTGPWQRKRG